MSSHYFPLGTKDIFNARGRINRMTFFMYSAVLEIIRTVVSYGFMFVLLSLPEGRDKNLVTMLYSAYGLFLLVYAWGLFCITAKRLHDLNLPALIAAIGVCLWGLRILIDSGLPVPLPLLVLTLGALAFGLCLLLIPGTKGANRFGAHALRPERIRARDLTGDLDT